MKNTNDISNGTKDLLAHAYQNVYDALVTAYLAKGQTRGQSQQSASRKIYQIINTHENNNPVIEYLRKFNDSHYSATAKKNMTFEGMDEIDSESLNVDMTDAIINAINNFESVIADASPRVLCVLNRTPAPFKHSDILNKQDFTSWFYGNPYQSDIKEFGDFETFYRRYFLRQSHR
ncbi:MAG: hypothetical protein II179_00165 [Alphaproteobacteria bacterium]|nr:hypothetical protein [Alphaproteobacteria bacterium]